MTFAKTGLYKQGFKCVIPVKKTMNDQRKGREASGRRARLTSSKREGGKARNIHFDHKGSLQTKADYCQGPTSSREEPA